MINVDFTVNPQVGDVYSTEFTFTDVTTSSNTIVNRIWDVGDGSTLVFDAPSISHVYTSPGTFTISLTVGDILGNTNITSRSVITDYVFRDRLVVTQLPDDYAVPGLPTNTPFKIALTSAQIDLPLNLTLYSANSRTTPYETVPSKWRFLTPTWRFLDKNYSVITTLSVEPVPLYKNSKVVGVSGEAEFYYVDDKCTGVTARPEDKCPLLITITLQTSGFTYSEDSKVYPYPGFANNRAIRAGIIWDVYGNIPTYLNITGNYLDEIYKYKWENIKIPFLITPQSRTKNYLFGSEETEPTILFSYPATNELGAISAVQVWLSGTDQFTVDEAPLYFQSTAKDGTDISGYIFSTITPLTTMNTTAIVASAVLQIPQETSGEQFAYPVGCTPNTVGWVSNPENKTISKVFYPPYSVNCRTINDFRNTGDLIDGYIQTITVPGLENTTSYNYSMSGFAGIYAMAVDPRNNELIATDAELDRIYKFSTGGTLLSTVELSTIGGIPSITAAYTPSNVCIDGEFNIYVSLFNAISVLKFDSNLNYLYSLVPSPSVTLFYLGSSLYYSSSALGFEELENFTPYSLDTPYGDYLNKPSMVETDRENNVFVSYSNPLYSVLVKYDKNGNVLLEQPLPLYSSPVSLAITLQNNIWIANSYNSLTNYGEIELRDTNGNLLSSFNQFIHPTYLTMDKYNNLWFVFGLRSLGYISKTGELSAWDVDTDGTLFSLLSSPIGFVRDLSIFTPLSASTIVTDKTNNVYYTVNSSFSTIDKFSTTDTLLTSITSTFFELNNICLDSASGLYVSDTNNISALKFDNDLNFLTTILMSPLSTPCMYGLTDTGAVSQTIYEDEEIGGLTIDGFNRAWLIDSTENFLHVFNAIPSAVGLNVKRTFKVLPDSLLGFYLNETNSSTYTLTGDYYKSLQANGDWTGNRWYQKHFSPNSLTAISVSGVSAPFSINNFYNSGEFRKVNESFDTAAHYKSLALPEVFSRYTNFFDNFLGAVVGNAQLSSTDDIGQTIYEKIANFVFNHADIDTCDIPQLLSYAQETSVPAVNFSQTFPPDIARYLNFASISRIKSFGTQSPLPILEQSVGSNLDVFTATVTAGQKLFLQNKFDVTEYTLVTVPYLNDAAIYPLSSISLPGFIQPVIMEYLFHEYTPIYSSDYIDNYIDWNSPFTSLIPAISTENELFGEDGVVEKAFNYLLTKNIIVK